MSDLYRKTALDKLSSPEQLDKMIRVTPPMFWVAAIGGGLILIAAIIWAVFAKLPVTVESVGVIRARDDTVLCYVEANEGWKIIDGMQVEVYPVSVGGQEYGHMNATVTVVDDHVASQQEVLAALQNDSLAESLLMTGPVIGFRVKLEKDKDTASGYKWSTKNGANVKVDSGILANVNVVVQEKSPISMIIPAA
ncbi:MAG: hypothetical protein IKQ97_09440 [Eubacterium sp.]|nr:hypothetical protein [Eubacterium sp.]